MNKFILVFISFIVLATTAVAGHSVNSIKGTKVQIETSLGNINILLYDETPLHRDNFIKLAKEGYFDNQIFHRVIKSFMIQGGDPNSKNAARGVLIGQAGPGYTIPAEFKPGLYHKRGALGAARKGDEVNPKKSSSGSQFYIIQGEIFTQGQLTDMVNQNIHVPFSSNQIVEYTTIGGSPHLDGSYTVFGEVTDGLEVVDKIADIPVDAYERPIQDVKYVIKVIR
jgi:cyclophilin family peptidyl-prolyl cis-trans isomerase